MEKIKKDVNEQENRAIQELENDSTKEKESEVSEKKVRKVKKQEETVAAIQEEKTEENEETEIVEEKVENLELPETEERKSKVGIILIIIAIIVVIIALTTTIFAAVNLKNTKILKGISIGKTDVSELTQEEAEKKLEEIYSNNNAEKKIYLSHGSYETSITYEALEVKYHIEKAVKEAYKIGRQGNVFQDNIEILKTWNEGKNVNLEVSMDNDMIEQIAQNINNSIDDTVVQPSYYIEENKNELVITAGKKGQKVDEEKLLEEIKKRLIEKKANGEIKRIYPEEPESIVKEKIEQKMDVSEPLFTIGIKDKVATQKEKVKKHLAIEILLNMLIGKSSDLYQELYKSGVMFSMPGVDYEFSRDYAHILVTGQSKEPEKVYESFKNTIRELKEKGIESEEFKRMKKMLYGSFIKEYDEPGDIARMFLADFFKGINSFEYLEEITTINEQYVEQILNEVFNENKMILSVIKK